MKMNNHNHRAILKRISHQAMLKRGLRPEFSSDVMTELDHLQTPVFPNNGPVKGNSGILDARNHLWSSIDNDDSRDLDQLTTAEAMPSEKVKILVAIADVDVCVKKGSAIDHHASINTTSVYTAAVIYPMLPELVSTDLTSLNLNEDRRAIVVEMLVGKEGKIEGSTIYRAWVHNHAKLSYNSLAKWLEKDGAVPPEVSRVEGLAENLRIQNRVAKKLKKFRHTLGALSLETIEAKPVFEGDQILELALEGKNRAKEIIEDFMIAANGVTARFLSAQKSPSIRRIVRTPKRWDRIVRIAADHQFRLPDLPDPAALQKFLVAEKQSDPLRFPDLSLAVIKLLGAGEYLAEPPGTSSPGHFGLAVKDYTHSTAPNRRYPDLITQRLLKAALKGDPVPYSMEELNDLAAHCTAAEDAANKVERQMEKSAAALLLESRIGEQFDAIITGASGKGVWVRLLKEPVEGKLLKGFRGLDVGDPIRVQLISVNVEKGFIDFKAV